MQLIAQFETSPEGANPRAGRIILASAILALGGYAALVALGRSGAGPGSHLVVHAGLVALMVVAYRAAPRSRGALRLVLTAALLFRIVATLGPPALSDDVYRFVWDGRVQLHGVHPYRYAPDDPALSELRDANWSRINHPELKTIYPPVAEGLFLLIAAAKAGPWGNQVAMALADFGVVWLLLGLLGRLGLPRHRIVLYAWNPLAVIETAGNAHVEPVGVALVCLAIAGISARRAGWSLAALAAAVHVKWLPLVLVPGFLRRCRRRYVPLLVALIAAPLIVFSLGGPAVGGGTWDYAERWEFNAVVFPAVRETLEAVDAGERMQGVVETLQRFGGSRVSPETWDWVYRHVWPHWIARAIVGLAAIAWIAIVVRRGFAIEREVFLVLAGVLILSPTLHPWYVLWVLPFAAAFVNPGWLVFAACVPLAYLTGGNGDVPWGLRLVEYGSALGAVWWTRRAGRSGRRTSRMPA